MFALQYSSFGAPDVLTVGPVDAPHAGPGQVRIAVRAAGVAPTDALLRAGRLRPSLAWPHVPGVDAAGVVDEVGEGVGDVRPGDEVFGAVDVMRLGGATAQYAVLQFWAPRPAALTWEQAAALGTSAETATRVLDLLGVGAGTTLLVDGAAGGVGSVAVQLAVARGARVVGTGSPATRTSCVTSEPCRPPTAPACPTGSPSSSRRVSTRPWTSPVPDRCRRWCPSPETPAGS